MALTPDEDTRDLETRLEAAIEEFEDERKHSWEDRTGEEDDFLYVVDGVGNFLLRAGRFLIEPDPNEDNIATWQGSKWLAEHPLTSEEVMERLQISVAREFALGADKKAERCKELTGLVIDSSPCLTVLEYLQRVTRCYIAGFYPECMILCRAVFENALTEKFNNKGVPTPKTDKGKSEMQTRIAWAVRANWLSHQGGTKAREIWKRGSMVAHGDDEPDSGVRSIDEGHALQFIKKTMAVLRELYDGRYE